MRRHTMAAWALTLGLWAASAPALAYNDGRFGMAGDGVTTCNACHVGQVAPTVTVLGLEGWRQNQRHTLTIQVQSLAPPSSNPGPTRVLGFGAMLLPTQGQDSRSISFQSRDDGLALASGPEAVHYSPIPLMSGAMGPTASVSLDALAREAGRFTLYLAINDADGDRTNRCHQCDSAGRYDRDDHTTNLVLTVDVEPAPTPDMGMAQDMASADMGSADMGRADMGRLDMGRLDMGRADMTLADMTVTDINADATRADLGSGRVLLDPPAACQSVALGKGAGQPLTGLCWIALAGLTLARREERAGRRRTQP